MKQSSNLFRISDLSLCSCGQGGEEAIEQAGLERLADHFNATAVKPAREAIGMSQVAHDEDRRKRGFRTQAREVTVAAEDEHFLVDEDKVARSFGEAVEEFGPAGGGEEFAPRRNGVLEAGAGDVAFGEEEEPVHAAVNSDHTEVKKTGRISRRAEGSHDAAPLGIR